MNKHFNPQLMLLAATAALTMTACTDDNNGDKPGIDDAAYVVCKSSSTSSGRLYTGMITEYRMSLSLFIGLREMMLQRYVFIPYLL